ncbi:trigger factor [Roseobacter denitrificans]|nr:trigger factor [Roseobacter denitrificans]SFF77562.1 hypothetical protein SAMN05443635_10276 [Roseobacter denitrificans OCh 114]
MQMSKARQLGDFEGSWTLSRRIMPRRGAGAVFEGTAIWSRAHGGLRYVEKGLMQIDGQAGMQAERRYFWSGELSVFFEDGRFFHNVPPHGGETEHWCDPDTYKGIYDFTRWPQFEVTWQVTGPKKDYLSKTLYTRA